MHFSVALANDMNPKNSDISAVILAKNEEKRIGRCLESLEWAAERIVIDNGSTDQTAVIAKRKSAVVVRAHDATGFAHLRNIGKEHAHGAWILYVDADEQVTKALQDEILGLIAGFQPDRDPVAYFIKRKNLYLGHPWPYRDKMERLFWSKALTTWEGELHESPKVAGTAGELSEPLIHDTHRTLEEMVDKTNKWSEIEATLRQRFGHPAIVWWRLLRVMVTGFSTSYIMQQGWRAGTVGLIESIYQGFSMFITYAKLWEMQQKDQR